MRSDEMVFVETAARLHFGVLDLRGSLGRWFGGIGAAAHAPTLLVSAQASDTVTVEGEAADRAREFAERFLASHALNRGVHIQVHRMLPSHAGLGSARSSRWPSLERSRRSTTSIQNLRARPRRRSRATFGHRHMDVRRRGNRRRGGRHREGDAPGPLVARLAFPDSWRCVIVVPHAAAGVSGLREVEAFAQLPPPPGDEVAHVAHLVLMALLPAVVEDDVESFGSTLTEIQEVTGRWFAPVQGGHSRRDQPPISSPACVSGARSVWARAPGGRRCTASSRRRRSCSTCGASTGVAWRSRRRLRRAVPLDRGAGVERTCADS
jgi:predicted sugar kinase